MLVQNIPKTAARRFGINALIDAIWIERHAADEEAEFLVVGGGKKRRYDGHDTRAIQLYLGHSSIASTVRYTASAPDRFKGFWKDWPRPAQRRNIRLGDAFD